MLRWNQQVQEGIPRDFEGVLLGHILDEEQHSALEGTEEKKEKPKKKRKKKKEKGKKSNNDATKLREILPKVRFSRTDGCRSHSGKKSERTPPLPFQQASKEAAKEKPDPFQPIVTGLATPPHLSGLSLFG